MVEISSITDLEQLNNIVYGKNSTPDERISATKRLVGLYSPRGEMEHKVRHRLRGIALTDNPKVPDEAKGIALDFSVEQCLIYDMCRALAERFPKKRDGTEFPALEKMQERLFASMAGEEVRIFEVLGACDHRFCEYIAQKALENPAAFKYPTDSLITIVKSISETSDETRIACLAKFVLLENEQFLHGINREGIATYVVNQLGFCLESSDNIVIAGFAKAIATIAEQKGIKKAYKELEGMISKAMDRSTSSAMKLKELLPTAKAAAEEKLSGKNPLEKGGLALDGRITPPKRVDGTGVGRLTPKQPAR
jgi:hypothetical protein